MNNLADPAIIREGLPESPFAKIRKINKNEIQIIEIKVLRLQFWFKKQVYNIKKLHVIAKNIFHDHQVLLK